MEIIGGIIMIAGGILLKIFTKHFEENILIKRSKNEQEEYWKNEKRLSEYTFMIWLGVALIITGIIF